jgi:hypothetical protein
MQTHTYILVRPPDLTESLLSPSSRKHAIETTDMLDFLKELVEGVPDPSAGGTISLDEPGDGEPATSSRRKGKKAATSAGDDGDEDGGRAQPTKRRAMPTAVLRMEIETM